jgi:hypothetical protein
MVELPQSHKKKTTADIRKKNPMAGPPICCTALWPQFPESHARLNGLGEPRVARKTGEEIDFLRDSMANLIGILWI